MVSAGGIECDAGVGWRRGRTGCRNAVGVPGWTARPFGNVRPDVPALASIHGTDRRLAVRAHRHRAPRRPARRERRALGRPGRAHHRSEPEPRQPRQSDADSRRDLHRAILRPRHHLRHRVEARHTNRTDRSDQRTYAPLRSRLALRRRSRRFAAAVRPDGSSEAQDRTRRPVRRPAPQLRRQRHHRRSAQRREPHHRRAAVRVHQVPQPCRRCRPGRAARVETRRVQPGAPTDALALPVDDRARVPAALRRTAARRRAALLGSAVLSTLARVHAGRVPRRGLPHGTQHGAALLPSEPQRQSG